MSDFVYSFACPLCHGSWQFEEFAKVAKDVFDSFEGAATCPRCNCTFSWTKPGELDGRTADGKAWYEVVKRKHYKPHPCEWCGHTLYGPRRFCNTQCNKKWYYRQKYPEVQRKTPIISPPGGK